MNSLELVPGSVDRAAEVSTNVSFDASDGVSRPIAPPLASRPGPTETIVAGSRFVPQSRLLGGSGEREVHTMDSEGAERLTAEQDSPTESVKSDHRIVPPPGEVQEIYRKAGVGPDGTLDLGDGNIRAVEFSTPSQQAHDTVSEDTEDGVSDNVGTRAAGEEVNTHSDSFEHGYDIVMEDSVANPQSDVSRAGGDGGDSEKPPRGGGSDGGGGDDSGDNDVSHGRDEDEGRDNEQGEPIGLQGPREIPLELQTASEITYVEPVENSDLSDTSEAVEDGAPAEAPDGTEIKTGEVGEGLVELPEMEQPTEEIADPDPYGIKAAYEKIAGGVVGSLEDSDVTVVTGPWRSGKSTTLIPQIEQNLTDAGNNVVSVQGFQFIVESEELAQGLPDLPDRNGVIIVDEARISPSRQEQLNETLDAIRAKGYTKVIAILPRQVDESDVGLGDLAGVWGKAINGDVEREIPMTSIPRAELADAIAEKFVRDRAEENELIRPSTDEATAYVIANVPHTLHALDSVAGSGDLGHTLNAFSHYLTAAEGSMPEAERQLLIAKVTQDLADFESGIQISIGDGHYQPPDDGRERVFIGKQSIDASDVEDIDEGNQDQHPHDVQEIVDGALKELAADRKAGRTGVEGFDFIDAEPYEVVEPVDPRVQALVDESLRNYVTVRIGKEEEVVPETAAAEDEPDGTTSPAEPVDVYFAEGGKIGDVVKINLPGEEVYGNDEHGIKAWKDELEASRQPVTEFVGIPLSTSAPNECVDGRTNMLSEHGPMMPGGSLFAEVILAIDSGSPFDEQFIGEQNTAMADKGYKLGFHYGSHHDIDKGICDCGFADKLPDIIQTSVNQRALITDRLLGVYDANPGAFAMEKETFAGLLGNVFDKMEEYIGEKVILSGEMLIRRGIEDGAVQEMVLGDHAESAAIVNLDPTVTFDTNVANSRGQQAFNLDLPHAVEQAQALGVEGDFATAASLILYASTEIVLVEQKGKPALPILLNTAKKDPHTSDMAD